MKGWMMLAAATAALFMAAATPPRPVWAGPGFCKGVEVTVGEGNAIFAERFCFTPTVLYVEPGETVEFDLGPDSPHTVTGANLSWGSAVSTSAPRLTFTFDEPGVYPYYCSFHPGMAGAIVVSAPGGSGQEVADRSSALAAATTGHGGPLDGTSWLGFGVIAAVVGGGGAFAAFRLRRGKTA